MGKFNQKNPLSKSKMQITITSAKKQYAIVVDDVGFFLIMLMSSIKQFNKYKQVEHLSLMEQQHYKTRNQKQRQQLSKNNEAARLQTALEKNAKLQLALAQVLDQNQILRDRVIQLQALLVASQQQRSKLQLIINQRSIRLQPSRLVKRNVQYKIVSQGKRRRRKRKSP